MKASGQWTRSHHGRKAPGAPQAGRRSSHVPQLAKVPFSALREGRQEGISSWVFRVLI